MERNVTSWIGAIRFGPTSSSLARASAPESPVRVLSAGGPSMRLVPLSLAIRIVQGAACLRNSHSVTIQVTHRKPAVFGHGEVPLRYTGERGVRRACDARRPVIMHKFARSDLPSMKMVVAIIRDGRLEAVRQALEEAGFGSMTVSRVLRRAA